MIIVLMAMLAFAVDSGYLMTVKTELKRSSDAAALAGAARLYEQANIQTEITTYTRDVVPSWPDEARTVARRYVDYNRAAGRALEVTDGDIVIGHRIFDADDVNYPIEPTLDAPDSVLVRIPLNDSHLNGSVNLFFAQALGIAQADVLATSMASVKWPGGLLPFGISADKWNSLGAGGDGDSFGYSRGTGTDGVDEYGDGTSEISIFPGSWNGQGMPPGNFGLLFIGSQAGGPSVIRPQIDDGVSAADLDHHGGSLNDGDVVNGKTGLKSGNKHALMGLQNSLERGIIGDIRYMVIYDDASGNGNNATFTISKFVMVRIMAIEIDGTWRTQRYDSEGEDITGFSVQPVTNSENLAEIGLTL